MILEQRELGRERARHGKEEVEVDEGAGGDEEQLVYHLPADEPGERRARDDRREHHEHDESPEARGEDVVGSDSHEVRREHRERLDFSAGIRGAEDREPREAGEERLERLQDEAEDDVLGVDRGQRVPERREPALDVDTEQMEDENGETCRSKNCDRPRQAVRQSVTQRRKPPRNASSLCPRRQFSGSSSSSLAFPPPRTT